MKHDPTFWILARATGMLAFGLVSATVIAGPVLKGRPLRMLKPAGITDVHRFLSLLGLMAVAAHAVALVLDSSVDVSLQALVVPGLVPYRPLWTGIGVVAAELMLLIHLSFRFRKRIGVKNWRRLHYATYLVFIGATTHGLLAGTDSSKPWAIATYVILISAVVGLTVWRATMPKRPKPPVPAATPRPTASSEPPLTGTVVEAEGVESRSPTPVG